MNEVDCDLDEFTGPDTVPHAHTAGGALPAVTRLDNSHTP